MWENIKAHPLITGAVVIFAIIVFMLFSGGGGGGVASGVPQSAVATGDALQMAQLQAQTIGQQTAAAGQAQSESIAANLEGLKLTLASKDSANILAANIASQQINADLQKTTTHDTLSAGVANATIKGQTDLATIQSNTQIQTTQALTNALTDQAAFQYYSTVALANNNQGGGNSSCMFFC